jgi:hypothetical protein
VKFKFDVSAATFAMLVLTATKDMSTLQDAFMWDWALVSGTIGRNAPRKNLTYSLQCLVNYVSSKA